MRGRLAVLGCKRVANRPQPGHILWHPPCVMRSGAHPLAALPLLCMALQARRAEGRAPRHARASPPTAVNYSAIPTAPTRRIVAVRGTSRP
jgi:hypothetical protein